MKFRHPVKVADLLGHCLGAPPFEEGGLPGEAQVIQVCSLDAPHFSDAGSLTFLRADTAASVRNNLRAAFVVYENEAIPDVPGLRVTCLRSAVKAVLEASRDHFFHRPTRKIAGNVHSTAIVEGVVEKGAVVGAGCYVGQGSVIGEGSLLLPNVTVLENCLIGRDCHLQPGAVISVPGFGFFESGGELQTMPHPAGVVIEDRVWIGANTVVAAGVLNPTRIGAGSKLDSHVQVAHNVFLGEGALVASQSGIAGSTLIGRHFRMGGASSIAGHLEIGDNVSVAACSGVTKHIKHGHIVAGFPAQAINAWKRQLIVLRNLGRKGRGT